MPRCPSLWLRYKAVHPFVSSRDTLPGDWARPQMQQRILSAMHPEVFFDSVRSQKRDAWSTLSESDDSLDDELALPSLVRRFLCQRGPGHSYTLRYIYIHSDTYIYIHIHTYTYMYRLFYMCACAYFAPQESRFSAIRWQAESFSSWFMILKPEVPGLRFMREPFRFTPLCLNSVT